MHLVCCLVMGLETGTIANWEEHYPVDLGCSVTSMADGCMHVFLSAGVFIMWLI